MANVSLNYYQPGLPTYRNPSHDSQRNKLTCFYMTRKLVVNELKLNLRSKK